MLGSYNFVKLLSAKLHDRSNDFIPANNKTIIMRSVSCYLLPMVTSFSQLTTNLGETFPSNIARN